MRNYSITGHMVVKNEDCWVWFAIMSVIEFLDKLIIFDTGSIDNTNRIIKMFLEDDRYKNKIYYEELGNVTPEEFHMVRQRQIELTETEYFMVVDGDEIWYESSIKELDKILSDKHPHLVATRFINCCEDVFHYRYDERETYCINGITGAITIRVYSTRIPGIRCGGVYGVEGYIDETNMAVQEKGYSTEVMQGRYFHTSLLNRSSTQRGDFIIPYRRNKMGARWDAKFPDDFKYPEVFYCEFPPLVRSPFLRDRSIIRYIYRIAHFVKGMLCK